MSVKTSSLVMVRGTFPGQPVHPHKSQFETACRWEIKTSHRIHTHTKLITPSFFLPQYYGIGEAIIPFYVVMKS